MENLEDKKRILRGWNIGQLESVLIVMTRHEYEDPDWKEEVINLIKEELELKKLISKGRVFNVGY